MNRGGITETLAPPGTNSLEDRHVVDARHGQPSSYSTSTAGSEASSWTPQSVNNSFTGNGYSASSTYGYEQQTQPPRRDDMNGATEASSLSLGSTSVPQDYNGYMTYQNPTNSYGYGTTGYTGYYSGYQQQTNPSYSQPAGAYQSTSSPYQPVSSFQNTGSYPVPPSYSNSYYGPGDYQTAGTYPNSNYSTQTTWNDGNYANYSTYQYSNYPSTSSAYGSGNSAAASVQYQPQFKQWTDYHAPSEVSCAPGMENLSVTSSSNPACPTPGVPNGTQASNSQPPPTAVPSWRPEPGLSGLPSQQPSVVAGAGHDNYWKQHAAPGFQNQNSAAGQSAFYQPMESKNAYGSYMDEQRSTSDQGSNLQYPVVHQAPQIHQAPQQISPALDPRRGSRVQIQTNPRIVSNLALGLTKTDKAGSGTTAAAKPAYIGVSLPKPSDKAMSDDASDPALKHATFPKSLRGYVERALARCKDEAQITTSQEVLKELITSATADGTLYTQDWDAKPLFPLPDMDGLSNTLPTPPPLPTFRRSPGRRTKSRWEPLPEEKSINKMPPLMTEPVKYGGYMNDRNRKPYVGNSESKDGLNTKKILAVEQKTASFQKPFKRQRLSDSLTTADNGDASSDSDKESSLTAFYSGAIGFSNTPEERKKRESRSKRFEKAHGNRVEINHFKPKSAVSANLYARRATAIVLSKTFEESGSKAVEDIDWDALTVRGTCQEIEKRYLRLTSAPDPATVRPEEVLEKALTMVQNSQKNYLYKCDQLKSIRQDLTVQRIRNKLTVKVYETHARLALEVGDLPEYNQCQSQLKTLYAEGIEGCHMEFSAYNLLCVILHSNNYRDLLSSMSRLSNDAKNDKAVKHALAVRRAVTTGNYVMFFGLYRTAPNLNSCLMDLFVDKMRYKAVNCMCRSYRPTVPVSYVAKVLGFAYASSVNGGSEEKDSVGLEECVDWLKAHGACLVADNNGEMQLDTKASSSSLYIPEPGGAVAHGDTSLAVNDFLTRASS